MSEETDFLEVDQNIAGQNYVCLSFVSPEKVLKKKEIFLCKKFLTHTLNKDFSYQQINDLYDDFMYINDSKLTEEFNELVDFQTNVRCIKVRGTYDTLKEANLRAKILQRKDPKFNVFVGQVGYWLPWDPSSDKIDAIYENKQMNTLVEEYNKNMDNKETIFNENKEMQIQSAKKEAEIKKELLNKKIDNNENSIEKIKELREIVDDRDKMLLDMMKQEQNTKKEEEKIFTSDDPWLQKKKLDEVSKNIF